MTRLADDWPDQRQTCVDVLCAYLRIDLKDHDGERTGETQVKAAINSSILDHVQKDGNSTGAVPTWSDLRFDFRSARMTDFDLADATFNNEVTFQGSVFAGHSFFTNCVFNRGLDMGDTTVEGALNVLMCTFNDTWQAFGLQVGEVGAFLTQGTDTKEDAALEVKSAGIAGDFLFATDNPSTTINLRLDSVTVKRSGRLKVDLQRSLEWRPGHENKAWLQIVNLSLLETADVELPFLPGKREAWPGTLVAPTASLRTPLPS